MGTARTSHEPFSFDLQYDDTEQPQRRVWIDQYDIDRDEVSLGEYLLWLRQQERHPPEEVEKLIDHVMTIHAMQPETLTRWPALYVTWPEASDYCRARDKRLPTEAEWEKAARGDSGKLFPWGQKPPTSALAMFGQYHVHEIPIVASVDSGEEGRSPYGLHHMAGNAAEWVEDWFGSTIMRPCRIATHTDLPTAGTRWCAEDRGKVRRRCCERPPEAGHRRMARRDHRISLRTLRAIVGCGKSILQTNVSIILHSWSNRGAVLQDAQKGRQRGRSERGGEAYPCGTLSLRAMREQSWQTFSASC